MYLQKTNIDERMCGLILKPFDDAWLFTPRWGRWIVIPLTDCTLSDGAFLISAYANAYVVQQATEITGKALILLVNKQYTDNYFAVSSDKITFDREDLYTNKDGIALLTTLFQTAPSLINPLVASFYHINVDSNNVFLIYADYRWEILKDGSGIKSGQFIL